VQLKEAGKVLETLLALVPEVKGVLGGHQAGGTDLLRHRISVDAAVLGEKGVQHFPNGWVADIRGEEVHQYGRVFGAGAAVLSHGAHR